MFQDTVARVADALRKLDEWREHLPQELQVPLDLPPEIQIPLDDAPPNEKRLPPDRALCMLHMKWNQVSQLTFVTPSAIVPGLLCYFTGNISLDCCALTLVAL